MDWRSTEQQLPGGSPVADHSPLRGVEAAASVAVVRSTTKPRSVPDRDVFRLDGPWLRTLDPEESSVTGPISEPRSPTFDAPWREVTVPDNYGNEPEARQHFGPVWYRTALPKVGSRRAHLVLPAAGYFADILIGGDRLCRHEGYFTPFEVDVTGRSGQLDVVIQHPMDPESPISGPQPYKRWIMGNQSFHDSRRASADDIDRYSRDFLYAYPVGGILEPVQLIRTGDLKLAGVFATPLSLDGSVHLAIVVRNLGDSERHATITIDCDGDLDALDGVFPAGLSRIDLVTQLPNAPHWEIGRPGEQMPMIPLKVGISIDGQASDSSAIRFGIRTSDFGRDPMKPTTMFDQDPDFRWVFNGHPTYIRSANYQPVEHFADVSRDLFEQDINLAKDAHMNALGIHACAQPEMLYDVADELGMPLFQDFPLQWNYVSGTALAPEFVDTATRMAADLAYRLYNHPSVVYWAAHNEPAWHISTFAIGMIARSQGFELDPFDWQTAVHSPFAEELGLTPEVLSAEVDLGNQLLDEALTRTIHTVDPTRYVHWASGLGIDNHDYSGSLSGNSFHNFGYQGESRFVSEFGNYTMSDAALEVYADLLDHWPPDESTRAILYRGSVPLVMDRIAGPLEGWPDAESWIRAGQRVVAEYARWTTQHMRIKRERPFVGYRYHFLVNHWGHAGAGLLNVDRTANPQYRSFAQASRPVLVTCQGENSVLPAGQSAIPMYLINDSQEPVSLEVTWRIEALSETELIRYGSDIKTDMGDTSLAVLMQPMDGVVAFEAPGARRSEVATGRATGQAGPFQSQSMGEIQIDLDEGGYLVTVAWGAETNDFIFYATDQDLELPFGATVR